MFAVQLNRQIYMCCYYRKGVLYASGKSSRVLVLVGLRWLIPSGTLWGSSKDPGGTRARRRTEEKCSKR